MPDRWVGEASAEKSRIGRAGRPGCRDPGEARGSSAGRVDLCPRVAGAAAPRAPTYHDAPPRHRTPLPDRPWSPWPAHPRGPPHRNQPLARALKGGTRRHPAPLVTPASQVAAAACPPSPHRTRGPLGTSTLPARFPKIPVSCAPGPSRCGEWRYTHRQAGRQACRQAGMQAGRQAGSSAHTSRCAHAIHTHAHARTHTNTDR